MTTQNFNDSGYFSPRKRIDKFKEEISELNFSNNLKKEELLSIAQKYSINLNDREIEYLLRYLQRNKGNLSSFMTVNLFENLSLDEKRIVLKEEINKFDLEKFLLDETDSQAGVLFIDDSSFIMVDCFTTKYTTTAGDHSSTVKNIYSAIKKDKLDFKGYPYWQKKILDEKIIIGQLCSRKDLYSVLWIPDDISLEQYNYLVSFNMKLKEIYLKHQNYFNTNPFKFIAAINDDEFMLTNGIDEILEILSENFVKKYNVK